MVWEAWRWFCLRLTRTSSWLSLCSSSSFFLSKAVGGGCRRKGNKIWKTALSLPHFTKCAFLKCSVNLKLLSTNVWKRRGKLQLKRAMLFLPVPEGRQLFSVCLLCGVAESREGNVFSEDFKRSTSLSLEMNYPGRSHQGQFYWRPFTRIFGA